MSQLWVNEHIKEASCVQRTIYVNNTRVKINEIPVMWDLFPWISSKRAFWVPRLFWEIN